MGIMKKFLQFLLRVVAAFGFVAGLYYLYKKYVATEIMDGDIEEDYFDDFDFDDEDFTETVSDTREYVTLNASESKNLQNENSDETISSVTD